MLIDIDSSAVTTDHQLSDTIAVSIARGRKKDRMVGPREEERTNRGRGKKRILLLSR